MNRVPSGAKILTLILLLALPHCSARSQPATLSGTITIPSSLTSKIGPSDVVFVMAFSAGAESQPLSGNPDSNPSRDFGSPVAVQKIVPPIFPLPYRLSQDDVIFPEKRFEGSLIIMARIDKDGNAKTVQGGDLEGIYKKNPVIVGTKNVDVVIDKER